MAADPFSIVILVLEFFKIAAKLRSSKDEMLAHKETVQVIYDLLHHVEAIRKRLSKLCTIPDEGWIDSQLAQVKSALEMAEKMATWAGDNRSGASAIIDDMIWTLKHKDAAEAHKIPLMMYHNTLLHIRDVLSKKEYDIQPRALEIYFEEARARTLVALSNRVMMNANLYSGIGVQTSRSRLLFEPEQQSVFSPLRPTSIPEPSRPLVY
jgi:hypothetical protein